MSSSSPTTLPSKTNPEKLARRDNQTENLKSKIAALESQISAGEANLKELNGKLKNPNATATVSRHIKLLHDYNEIRDVGQGLMGLIADARGEQVGVIQEEFGMWTKD